jgi:hypothetical protein
MLTNKFYLITKVKVNLDEKDQTFTGLQKY